MFCAKNIMTRKGAKERDMRLPMAGKNELVSATDGATYGAKNTGQTAGLFVSLQLPVLNFVSKLNCFVPVSPRHFSPKWHNRFLTNF